MATLVSASPHPPLTPTHVRVPSARVIMQSHFLGFDLRICLASSTNGKSVFRCPGETRVFPLPLTVSLPPPSCPRLTDSDQWAPFQHPIPATLCSWGLFPLVKSRPPCVMTLEPRCSQILHGPEFQSTADFHMVTEAIATSDTDICGRAWLES